MEFSLFDLLSWYLVFLFSLVAHEASHALAAWKLGDPTAYLGGQVTLDPTPHLKREPVGMVVLPLVTFLSNGWMIGWASAPYNRAWAQAFPKRAAIMAAAGPVANLAILFIAFGVMKAGLAADIFTQPFHSDMSHVVVSRTEGGAYLAARFLSIAFTLNLILFAFNLIPLPPLDGSAMIKIFLPDSLAHGYDRLISNPAVALAGLAAAWFVFPKFGGTLLRFGMNMLY